MPQTAIVDGEIACFDIEANFSLIRVIVYKLSLAEEQTEEPLGMGTGQYTESAIFGRAIVQVKTDIQHGPDAGPQEKIPWAVSMPSQLFKGAGARIDIVVKNQPIFFILAYPSFIVAEELDKGL